MPKASELRQVLWQPLSHTVVRDQRLPPKVEIAGRGSWEAEISAPRIASEL